VASLYRKTSIACPFTNGSFGSWISRGTISVDEGFFKEVVREANVFDRGRKGDDEGAGEVGGEEVPALENARCAGESFAEASEAAEWDREDIGTIRLCRLWLEVCGESGDMGLVNSSGGISSAAGMGRPLPAATS
jgi:hypothetical protein